MDTKERILELDILRIFAILIIVILVHIVDYSWNFYTIFDLPGHSNLPDYLLFLAIYLGLGLLIFLSGFCIRLQYPEIDSKSDIILFYKKRLVRILPLYWLALIAFFLIYDISLSRTIYHVFGLQMIFAPEYVNPIFTLWFIGLIIMLYFLYPILIYFGKNLKRLIIVSVGVFIIFVIIRLLTNLIEIRFFLYYFVFIGGIITCRYKSMILNTNKFISALMITGFITFVILYYFAFQGQYIVELSDINRSSTYLDHNLLYIGGGILLINLVIITFFFISFAFSRFIKERIKERGMLIVTMAAYSSYVVYLFHRPFFSVISLILDNILNLDLVYKTMFIYLSIPFLLYASYICQSLVDKLVLRKKIKLFNFLKIIRNK